MLRHLARLELNGTPLAEDVEYRQNIFSVFQLLHVVDGINRNGEEVEDDFDDSEEGSESSGSNVEGSEEESGEGYLGVRYPFVDNKKQVKEEKKVRRKSSSIEEGEIEPQTKTK